jgi:phage terminase large subunit-like protein
LAKRKGWRKPEYPGEFPSLGWQIVDFMEAYLRVPGGDTTGDPLRLTDEQVEFIVRAHRIDPITGLRRYRRAALRRAKGWGKSPLVGGLSVAHLCGPVVFDGWDANGEPVAKPHPSPWVQVAATSEDQTDNTYSQLLAMLAESPVVDECRLDVGITRIFTRGRPGRLEPVSAAAGSREGQPVTFAVLDETHLWTPTNGGVKLAATLRRNVAKTGGLSIETTNAHRPGEASVAESTYEAAERGLKDLLYDSVEAPAVADLDDRVQLVNALRFAYKDATWVPLERVADEFQDPSNDPADLARFYLNQLVAHEEDAVEQVLWDALKVDASLQPGDTITVGFDGSDVSDATALVAIRASDRTAFVLGLWERPDGARRNGWSVPRDEVRAVVAEAMENYRVVRMFCDPPHWQADLDAWIEQYGSVVVKWPSYSDSKIADATARVDTLLRSGELLHDGNAALRRHVLNTRRARCRGGWRPAKKEPTRKIDAYVALCAAVAALGDAQAKGDLTDAQPFFAY